MANIQLENEEPHDKLRKEAWTEALHTYAVSYLFNKRKIRVVSWLRIITFLGVLIPVSVGAIVLNYGKEAEMLDLIIFWIVSPLASIQLVVSLWAIIAKWNEKSEYLTESTISNSQLSDDFKMLGSFPPTELSELMNQFERIQIQKRARDQQDNKYPLSEKEKREGMRYALRKFQRSCVSCGITPVDMKATDCPVCGNF